MTDFRQPQDWGFPVPIAYGPGRLAGIGSACAQMGVRNPLVVTDRGSARLPFVAAMRERLSGEGLSSGLFADVSPNPRGTEIGAGAAQFRKGGHDAVIAIGGGSGMDAGKAVALTARSGVGLWDFEWEKPPAPVDPAAAFPPLICVPTTAGTGAETDSTAMVTDTGAGMKLCIAHPGLKPALALLDPELTLGLPRDLTAWTGVDALVHAIEALCVPDFHPLCDGAALEAMRLIGPNLPRAVADGADLPSRGAMLVGSCLGGIAFLKGLGLVHAISHMVGAEHDTHHGLTNAIVLPAVLRFNREAIAAQVEPMTQALGVKTGGFDALHGFICDLLDRLDIPKGLAAIGVTDPDIPGLAAKAMRDTAYGTSPRKATRGELETLIAEAVDGAR